MTWAVRSDSPLQQVNTSLVANQGELSTTCGRRSHILTTGGEAENDKHSDF
jgi:hypothetical protein